MSENKDKVSFKYIFEENYNPKYINGASGGISPNNEIIINFYLERPSLPYKISYSLEEDQLIEEEREPKDNKSSFVRCMQNGIIFDYSTAKALQRFLNTTISEYEQQNSIEGDE